MKLLPLLEKRKKSGGGEGGRRKKDNVCVFVKAYYFRRVKYSTCSILRSNSKCKVT